MDTEYAVIGGGVVGLSIAYGLLRHGKQVAIFDEGDVALRASRGNFGLVWVQSKGIKKPEYAQWTRRSARSWRGFADALQAQAETDIMLVQDGGYIYQMDEDVLASEAANYKLLQDSLGGDYPFEVMDNAALRAEEPATGPKVAGAIYCPEDGHLNPLRLLHALATSVRLMGAKVHVDGHVENVVKTSDGFEITTKAGKVYQAEKVVLAAGLGAQKLGPKLGFKAPVRAQQGQVLITEKMPKILNRPNVQVRQVNEGGIQIGATADETASTKEDVVTMSVLARNAIDMFPILERANFVRGWAACRIMSPDGAPIYEKSKTHEGAFFVTCHSGITLAAAHATDLPHWILGTEGAPDLSGFSEERFSDV